METILDCLQLVLLFVAVSFIVLVFLDNMLKSQDDPSVQSEAGSGFVEKAVVEVDKVEGQPIKEDQSVDDEVSKTVGGVGNVEEESFNVNGGVCGSVERLLDEGSSEKPEYGGIELALAKNEVGVVCLSEKSVEEESLDNDVDGGLCGNLESLVDESCENNKFDLAKGEVGVVCSPEKNVGEESSGEHWGVRVCVEDLVHESSEKHEFGEIEVDWVRNNVEIAEIEEESFNNDVDGGLCGNLESLVDESCENNEFDLAKGEVRVVCSPEKNVGEESSREHCGVRVCVENLVDESSEKHEFGEIKVDLVRNKVEIAEIEEIKVSACNGNESDGVGSKVVDGVSSEELFDEDNDWEGIETTELERHFGAAVAFVGSKSNAVRVASLVSDVKMRLDGLHKIATRGPCLQPQPMVFKISARAKWNAWQQLGNMSAEVAMEQYISLLSECVPGWMQDVPGDFSESEGFEYIGAKSIRS